MLCVSGKPEIIYERNAEKFRKRSEKPRLYDEFYADEYSPERLRIYKAAQLNIDTSAVDQQTSVTIFRASVDQLIRELGRDDV